MLLVPSGSFHLIYVIELLKRFISRWSIFPQSGSSAAIQTIRSIEMVLVTSMASENGTFVVDLPIKDGDFP